MLANICTKRNAGGQTAVVAGVRLSITISQVDLDETTRFRNACGVVIAI